jgi:hypothetical protein
LCEDATISNRYSLSEIVASSHSRKLLSKGYYLKRIFFLWFKHPSYIKAKKSFIADSDSASLKNLSAHLPKILFICGGDPTYYPNRELIESYLNIHHEELVFFRAELAWTSISNRANKENKKTNALVLEEWLAQFSDAVIILVESFGTVAELGAFSLSAPLRKKLLPILDKSYESDQSFINTGPIHWLNNDSIYAPAIYTDFSTILTCMPQVVDKVKKGSIYKSREAEDKFGKLHFSRKEFLFFIIYIVTAIGPITIEEICDISSRTIGYGKTHSQSKEISFILSLGVALGLLSTMEYKDSLLYTCVNYTKMYRHKSTQRPLQKSHHLRARNLSDLLQISEFKNVLKELSENAG